MTSDLDKQETQFKLLESDMWKGILVGLGLSGSLKKFCF